MVGHPILVQALPHQSRRLLTFELSPSLRVPLHPAPILLASLLLHRLVILNEVDAEHQYEAGEEGADAGRLNSIAIISQCVVCF